MAQLDAARTITVAPNAWSPWTTLMTTAAVPMNRSGHFSAVGEVHAESAQAPSGGVGPHIRRIAGSCRTRGLVDLVLADHSDYGARNKPVGRIATSAAILSGVADLRRGAQRH